MSSYIIYKSIRRLFKNLKKFWGFFPANFSLHLLYLRKKLKRLLHLRKKIKRMKELNQKHRKKKTYQNKIHQFQMRKNPKHMKNQTLTENDKKVTKKSNLMKRWIWNFQALKMSPYQLQKVMMGNQKYLKEKSHFSWSCGRRRGPHFQKEKNWKWKILKFKAMRWWSITVKELAYTFGTEWR